MIHTKPKVYLATFKSPKCREKKKTLWRQTLVALFFINGNFYQLSGAGTGGARGATGPPNILQIS
jgi:hypothetical protein